MKHGFDVESFEISKPRAKYAREKLGVRVHDSISSVSGSFDIFFSSHVLEHVPSVKESIEFGMRILKPGGLFVAFTPNGSLDFRKKKRKVWDSLWGSVHPNFLDCDYYTSAFMGKHLFLSGRRPYSIEAIQNWRESTDIGETMLELDGKELLVLVKK